jgi:hypothetical protein
LTTGFSSLVKLWTALLSQDHGVTYEVRGLTSGGVIEGAAQQGPLLLRPPHLEVAGFQVRSRPEEVLFQELRRVIQRFQGELLHVDQLVECPGVPDEPFLVTVYYAEGIDHVGSFLYFRHDAQVD